MTNSFLAGEGFLLLQIPYLRQVNDTKKSSFFFRKSLSLCYAFNIYNSRLEMNFLNLLLLTQP